jgi:hypothetical protein
VSDRLARVLTGLAVLMVAVIAAVVSFTHIETFALAHGQPLVGARLMPVSVDGLLVVSSLVLLAAARAQQRALSLARAGPVLGVVATVLANVTFGMPVRCHRCSHQRVACGRVRRLNGNAAELGTPRGDIPHPG